MSYPWEEIKKSIKEKEKDKLSSTLSLLEQKEGFYEEPLSLLEGPKPFLEFLSEVSVGISIGIIAVIFNYLLWVWLLHIQF